MMINQICLFFEAGCDHLMNELPSCSSRRLRECTGFGLDQVRQILADMVECQ